MGLYEASAGVIPVLLLVLATQERLAFVRPRWRRSGLLHVGAILLGALIVGEVLALGTIRRGKPSALVDGYLLGAISAALGMVAWGLGWSIWDGLQWWERPPAGSYGKWAFYGIGLLTLLGLAGALIYAFA